MPEISQDIFEDKYPGLPPISPQELRFRANSFGNKKKCLTSPSENGCLLKPPSENDCLPIPNHDRKQKLSESDVDTFPHSLPSELLYGYKRQSSHR